MRNSEETNFRAVPVPAERLDGPTPLPPKTALDVILAAIDLERRRKKLLERFSFRYGGRTVEYWGRYYGYSFAPDESEESEFGGASFAEMLSDVLSSTGKALWQMLDELPPDAVMVEFDPDWPMAPLGEEAE